MSNPLHWTISQLIPVENRTDFPTMVILNVNFGEENRNHFVFQKENAGKLV